MLRYYANLKAIRHESTSSNRIVADELHHVIVAERGQNVGQLVGVLSSISFLSVKCCINLMSFDSVCVEMGGGGGGGGT